jgi:hypothetical protein
MSSSEQPLLPTTKTASAAYRQVPLKAVEPADCEIRQRRSSKQIQIQQDQPNQQQQSQHHQHQQHDHMKQQPKARRRKRRGMGGSTQMKKQSVLRRAGSHVFLPRMVTRDLPFHQSSNLVKVKNDDKRHHLWKLMIIDWFHTLLRLHPFHSVSLLLTLWVTAVVVFAGLYMFMDRHYHSRSCGLGPVGSPIEFASSFAFSLETCTTVGYSLPGDSNAFFESGCHGVQLLIFLQMMWSMMFNAFMFAFFFSLLSKSEFRSTQIIFTNKLLITTSTSDGQVYCRLQCYDIDSAYPLVEAHARMYLLDHKLKMHQMRLVEPNDELGGMLYPSIPTDIVHCIDPYSVLCPPECKDVTPLTLPPKSTPSPLSPSSTTPTLGSSFQQPQTQRRTHHPGIVLRSVDSSIGNRDDWVCPICGESYGTYERLEAHIEHSAMTEEHDGYPSNHPRTHIGYVLPKLQPITMDKVQQHMERTLSEIVVVVEAIDPQLSGTFQSLQSYKYEDIVFAKHAEYAKCMFVKNNKFTVDMNKFHTVETANDDDDESGYDEHDDGEDSDNYADNDDGNDGDDDRIKGDVDVEAAIAKWKSSLRPASTISNDSSGYYNSNNNQDGNHDESGGDGVSNRPSYQTFGASAVAGDVDGDER